MKYAPIPQESKSLINKAGHILSGRVPGTIDDFRWAIGLVSRWRACHAYPVNSLQGKLRAKLKENSHTNYLLVQRLKRLPTIVDKLVRFPSMQLSTMQDIGGLRAILPDIESTYRIRDNFLNSESFSNMLIMKDAKDYIRNPREKDGYRGLHLVFKYQNPKMPDYDGLRLEMQFRTKLQHTWATAVESMGTFLGQALKSTKGDIEWLDFFRLVSSAFAHREKQPLIPSYFNLSEQDTHEEIIKLEKKLGVVDNLIALSAVMRVKQRASRGATYFLLILDSLNHKIEIRSYGKDSFLKASDEYSEIELQVNNNLVHVEPVLVSSDSLNKLRKAFPNFFLDTTEFKKELTPILKSIETRSLIYKESKKKK